MFRPVLFRPAHFASLRRCFSSSSFVGKWKYKHGRGTLYEIVKGDDGAVSYQETLPNGKQVSGKLVGMKDGWYHADLGELGRIRMKDDPEGMVSQAAELGSDVWLAAVKAEQMKMNDNGEMCAVTGDKHREGDRTAVHFKKSQRPHPLVKKWNHPQVHHIWTPQELEQIEIEMRNPPLHRPQNVGDHVARGFVRGLLYNGFNFITRFNAQNPTVEACQWRLIILESVAAVPGMVAACLRHFRSLRLLKRDYGWIYTLLEEAENERMHLLICLKTFHTSKFTRFMVMAGQFCMTTMLVGTYIVHPKSLHRFVGYLEECACETYTGMINNIEKEGTHLNKGWKDIRAPSIAKAYYRLDQDAMWVDVLRCIRADEAHHRDVNHTFANLDFDAQNPFTTHHVEDARKAWTQKPNSMKEPKPEMK